MYEDLRVSDDAEVTLSDLHGQPGESNPQAKVSDAEVREIRRRYNPERERHANGNFAPRESETLADLADEFGLSVPYVSEIVNGKVRSDA